MRLLRSLPLRVLPLAFCLAQQPHYLARMQRVSISVPANLPGQRMCMLVSEGGDVRLEKTEAASPTISGKVYNFSLRAEQLQQLRALLGDPVLPQSGNDVKYPLQFRELDEFDLQYHLGDAFQHVKAVQDESHSAQLPLKNVEKWFTGVAKQKPSVNNTLKANNCSSL